jgi:hypothetical protein
MAIAKKVKIVKLDRPQKAFLVDYLRGTGRKLTAEGAKNRFGIENLTARMSELRDLGLKVNVEDSAYSVSARDIFGSRAKIALD